jgi:hypothetical protein
MRKSLALLLALPVLLVLLWLALGRGARAPAPEPALPAPVAESKPAPPAAVESAPDAADAQRVEATAQPERTSVPAPAAQPAEPLLAELRGRFVLEGGAPAAGAKILVHGWESNNERVLKYGRPKEEWKNRTAECDADGCFTLRFDPPRAYQFTLEASYAGCVTAHWRWGEIEPASKKDLGETLLPRGGAIAGRVVDAQGRSTRDAWQVYADALGVSKGDGSDASRAYTAADKETGQFRLEGLPPGQVELKAHSELANWIEGPKVEVRAGETAEANIQYTGPDNSRRITVVTFARPFYTFDSDVDEIVLSAPGMEPRKAQKIARSSQSFSFDELEPGSYSITIDDPKFKPWRKDGVQPGQRVSAKLVGASAASLAVLDAATRAPVARYSLRARFDESRWHPNEFEIFGPDRDPPAGGLVEGLLPVPQTLIVVAEGYAPCELSLAGLKAGELRPLTAELRKGATLVARVLQADGRTPIAGLTVTLEPSAPADQDQGSLRILGSPGSQREATSAADGSASFPATPPGTYNLRAEVSPGLAAELDGVAIAAADTRKDCELVLPPNGWLVGRVLGLDAAAAAGCSLVILSQGLSPEERGMLQARAQFDRKGPQNPVAADGSFRAGPLRAGKSEVTFQFPSVQVHQGPNSSFGMPGASIELGLVEIPAGGELRRDFDLRGKLPGRVEADVLVNGVPAAGAQVSVSSTDQVQRQGMIALDEHGHGSSGPVVAGPVRFDLSSAEGDWSWTPPGSWTITSGETLRVRWDVPLAKGALQFVDEISGLPLAEKQVALAAEADTEGMSSWVQRITDKQGRLELQMVPGAYRVQFLIEFGAGGKHDPSPYADTRVDWTSSGPSTSVLKIAKRP